MTLCPPKSKDGLKIGEDGFMCVVVKKMSEDHLTLSELLTYRYKYVGNLTRLATVATTQSERICDLCLGQFNELCFSLDPKRRWCCSCFSEDVIERLEAFDEENEWNSTYIGRKSVFRVLDPWHSFSILRMSRRFAVFSDVELSEECKEAFGLEMIRNVRGRLPVNQYE